MSEPSRTALVTNATGFAGPGAVEALRQAGFRVLVQDAAFADPAAWEEFVAGRSGLEPVAEHVPEQVIADVFSRTSRLDALISNDHYPAPAHAPETAPVAELRANYGRLIEYPFRLIQAALPHLRQQGGANIVMITSNRDRLPLRGGAFPDAARAGVNAMMKSLAIDCARDGIIINAVAPNFLYSEAYYPKAFFKETESGRAYVEDSVPVGRLADPSEIGEVITFLATARTRFMTGATIEFSGGWPFAPARPTP